jgi:acetylornithine aminotransferase
LAKEVSSAALSGGLLVNAVRPDAVRVAPPLLVTDNEIDAALAILADVMTGILTTTLAEPTADTRSPEAKA